MIRSKYFIYIQAVIGGLLAGIGISSLGIFLMPIAISILWSISSVPFAGAVWGIVAVLVSHRWLLSLHPLTWLGIPSLLSYLIVISIWLFCGFLAGCLTEFWCLLGKLKLFVKAKEGSFLNRILVACSLSSIWGLAEVSLSRLPLFWVGVSGSVLPEDSYLAGLASFLGAGGLALIQFLMGWWLLQLRLLANQPYFLRRFFAVGVMLIALLHFLGWSLLDKKAFSSEERIAIWQTNIPTREKFLPTQLNQIPFSLKKALDEAHNMGAFAMVAPEGTLQVNQKLKTPTPIPLLIGGFRKPNENQKSSLLVFNENETSFSNFIDKYRLVPIGEWIPKFVWPFQKGLSYIGGLEPGQPSRLLSWDGPPVAVAICYELSDGRAIAKAVREGAEWILTIANLDPYPLLLQKQFTALAELRSIETQRELISAANTGPSALVSSSGQVTKVIPSFSRGLGIVRLKFSRNLSGYVKWGETPLISFLLINLLGLVVNKNKFN